MSATAFHQEKVVNGVLSYRKNPKDGWAPFTSEELTEKIDTILWSFQKESADTTQERDKAITSAINTERDRILSIVDAEPEPGTPLPEEQKIIEGIPRIELGNLIVRAVKKSLHIAIIKQIPK